uniref:Midasin n=1 Tax=Amphimedon queenslandica TaxID=400682 RepID=A0A1X7TI19_AMPQE
MASSLIPAGNLAPTYSASLFLTTGVLVQAMRDGHWLILDELNLAPTDVLEALNRVLDDNRELYITETQQLVKAHPHFLLFGTQNPPGVYGGRKLLSRAFRNRFIELHYDDIPPNELVSILHQKCSLPEKYAKKMVAVMKDLQQRRSLSGIFEGKYGLVTLRDLFRWAERYRRSFVSENFYDWEQLLAEDGTCNHFKKSVDPLALFTSPGGLATAECLKILTGPLHEEFHHLYWTPGLLKTAVLLYRAIQFDEPTLLIGTTGCGKTTLCQLIAKLLRSELSIVNCHLHSEAADFLGGLRPIRNRNENEKQTHCLFEWRDGVLVECMKRGQCILIDEISLADDAVLERLNSVLEPERKLLVAERGGGREVKDEVIAASGFQFMATMNPGGDYGKKELSPALRNRFTEIWSTNVTSDDDYSLIIDHNIKSYLKGGPPWSRLMVDFMKWLKTQIISSRFTVTVRDVLLWVEFMNKVAPPLSPSSAFINGAIMIFIDSLGCGGSCEQIGLRDACINYLQELANETNSNNAMNQEIVKREGTFGIAPFLIESGSLNIKDSDQYCFNANGPCNNLYRLLRGLQLKRPIMLEGAPGVGKTSLVSALAAASGHSITRINLSEHTDVSDLFGSDLPVEGINGIKFEWRDGPFLKALRSGEWILLDEMNLASQSVLEGLNAVLDHRGELYIPELSKTFHVPCCTRLFACQNPVTQGGGRKGLPLSFVNRFTQVYLEPMSDSDLVFITCSIYPDMDKETVQRMVRFNNKVHEYCGPSSLWEFNLRDILRWSEVINKNQPIHSSPAESMRLLYTYRLRNKEMRNKVEGLYVECFNEESIAPGGLLHLSDDVLQIGGTLAKRGYYRYDDISEHLKILPSQTHLLDVLLRNTTMNWMTILVGEGGSGKSSLVRILSTLTGHKLLEYHMNTSTDTSELMGGFEQVNYERELSNLVSRCDYLLTCLRTINKGNYNLQIDELRSSLTLINNKEGSVLKERCLELKEVVESTLNIVSSSLQNESELFSDFQDLLCSCDSLCVKVCGGSTSGQFEWVNSILITALTHGYWLLVTQANFCSPSVLDRLNPLLEPNGALSIDERGVIDGTVPTVKPHKDFRLFLTMDPVHGEISRAMRNRGIEISILPKDIESLHCDLSSLSYSMSVKSLMSDPVTALVKRDLHYILIQFINSLNTRHTTINDLLSLQAHLRLFIDLSSASDVLPRYNALIKLADNISHTPLLQCVVMATADVLSDDDFKSATRRISLHLMFILGKDYQSHFNYKINEALHGVQPNKETDYFDGVVDSKLLYYTHKRLSICMNNEWSTAPSLFQSVNRSSVSSGSVIDRKTIIKLKEFLDTFLTELQCRSSDKILSDRAIDCLRLFVFTCHTPDWSVPKLAVSWSLLKKITFAEYEPSNNVASLLESCAVLDQLNSVDAHCIQLFRKGLGSPLPPASLMQINLMDLLLSATNKQHSSSPPLHILDDTTNRSSILQLMTEYHCSGSNNEEQDKEACLKLEELLTSIPNSQPSSSLVPDVVRLALNAIPDLFLAVSTSYDAESLAEKKRSFIRYCLRVPQWSLHSLLCIPDATNEAKNFTEWLELLSTDTNLSLSSSFIVSESLSDLTFSLLSSNDEEFPGDGSSTSITVQNFDKKCSELHVLLQFLFMKCFTEKSQSTKCEQEIQVLKDVLNRILLSLQSVIKDQFDINTVLSDTTHSLTNRATAVSELFLSLLERNEISGVAWSHFFTSLSSASVALESGGRGTREAVETARVAIGEGLVHLLAPVSAVDPLVMDNSTNEYLELLVTMNNSFIESFQSYMNAVAHGVQDQLYIHQSQSTPHQYVSSKMNSASHWTTELNKRQNILKRFHTERYSDLTEEASRVIQTLVFPGKIHQVLESGDFEREAWLESMYSAIKRLRENYTPYIDLVQPFIAGLTLLCKGIKDLADARNSLRLQSGCVGMLVRFPYWNESRGLGEQERIKQILEYCHKRNNDWSTSLKLITVAVEMSLSLLTKSKIGIKNSGIFVNVVNFCYLLWKEADARERQRQIEEESIYKYKPITCTITDEEEQETKEINSLFSNYDSYFLSSPDTDITTPNHTDSESAEIKKSDGIASYQMNETQMRLVKELHELLCYKESIHYSLSSPSPLSLPFQSTPSLSAVSLASEMWRGQVHASTRKESDASFVIGQARAVHSVLKAVSTNEQRNKSFIIYCDPLVSEARRARVVLIKLKERVREVLVELPDYPLLKQILFAVDQVLSLDLLSPLMKILAGLENVLKKSQDWEGYACSRLSISTQLSALTELVLEWRRLELNSWSNLLSMCKDDFISQSCKWWFYLYGLINEERLSESDAVTLLQSFIESSSIGDYTNRLRMIESFGLQLEEDNSSLSHILSNVHTYYIQFEESVNDNINQLSEPIETGLKDYLKILRWKDGNYWSIKQQSERSHATLSKHIKQYKDVLSQPVKPVLTTGSIKEKSHSSEGDSALEGFVSHLKSRDEKVTTFNGEFNFTLRLSEGDSSLSGTDAYNRLRQLLNRYKRNQLLLQWTEQLDEFTGSVISDYHSLQSNDIPSKLSKEEREAAIKLLLMKRKRAFTDLFKTLKSMGLSYRKGEELSDQNLQLLSLTSPSLIKEALDTHLINDCNLYFFRCVLRSAALNSALATPSKELSMTHVLWIRGYCVQLMEALCVQRETLYEGQKELLLFNHLLERLRVSSDCVAVSLTEYKKWLICLCDCLQQCIEGISACQEISEMIPDVIDVSLIPLPPSSLPPLLTEPSIMKKEGEKLSEWSKVLEDKLQTAIEYTKSMKRNELYFITRNELLFLTNGYTLLQEFVSDPVNQYLNAILGKHNDSFDSLCFMKHLQSKISLKCQGFSTWTADVVGSTNQIVPVTCDYESMLKPLLLGVQHVMEKEKVMKGKSEEDEDGLPVYKFLCDFSLSNLKEINTNEVINCLITILESGSAPCSSEVLIPFMEKYHSLLERVCYEHALVHRTLSKMTSCLLEIYTNVLIKGFCVPPELMEDTKGGEEFVDQEAGGFDEGEGANDVSENIDRNNLETGGDGTDQSQNEEGRKGDDKGIEMDEDFDGKLEDVPEKD